MTDNVNVPMALQSPNINYPIRTVLSADIPALRADIWSHRTVLRSKALITRIKDAKRFKRGLGIVVLDNEDTERIIGYGQIMFWTQCAEISDLVVSEAYRNKGIGTAIIQYLTTHIPRQHIDCIEIGVAQSNVRADALYKRLGFVYYSTLELQIGGDDEEAVDYLRIKLK